MNCDLLCTVIGTAIGVILGGIITWFVAKFYYKRASNELLDAADELAELSEFMIQYQLADKGTGIIVPKLEDGGLTLHKFIGTSPPAGAWDDFNKWLEERRAKRGLRRKKKRKG